MCATIRTAAASVSNAALREIREIRVRHINFYTQYSFLIIKFNVPFENMLSKDTLSYKVIGCALEVHKALRPGLLESAYEKALIRELEINNIPVKKQLEINIDYKGINIGEGLRLDLLINDELIVELKSVEELKPVHHKQLLTYLKLTGKQVGLLINFNTDDLMKGVKRIVNNFHS
jgi:GxxExxY protein